MDERDLQDLTQEYWRKFDARNLPDHLEWYIANLLSHEIQWAGEHPVNGMPRLPTTPCKLLVLLVGFSIEPLLQAVWSYEPEQALLLLNEQYGDPSDNGRRGADFGGMVKRLITEHLATQKPLPVTPQVECEVVEAGPVPVFRKLLDKVNTTEGVVVDITGAKKSMVAGAFLYAAYANANVSYVDFDDNAFDPEKRRPYGYACRIGQLSNPYQAFALRDWERVRALYNRYSFRAARELLVGQDGKAGPDTILGMVKAYLHEMVEPIEKLAEMLHCYELWDSGAFNEAKNKADQIAAVGWNSEFPSVVDVLGGKWFVISGKDYVNKPKRFFEDTLEFRVYVFDELERIERLFRNEDYRSAFLRAGGLNEIIMVARLVREISEPDKTTLLTRLDDRTPGAKKLFSNLLKAPGDSLDIKDMTCRVHNFPATLTQTMNDWWRVTRYFNDSKGWDDFLTKRNELAHKYFTVPADWAEDALCFVKANFQDFLGSPVESLNLCAEALPWSVLCQRCGVRDWLPPNLKEDQ